MDRKEIALKRARDDFAHWRATRKAKEPIPKKLLQLAARAEELSDVSSVAFESTFIGARSGDPQG